MGLLQSARDKEWFVAKRLLRKPRRDLACILPIFVLLIREPAGTVARRRLGIEFRGNLFLSRSPLSAIWPVLNRTVFRFKRFPCLTDNRKFVVIESNIFVPRDFAMFMSRRMKHFSNTRCPIPILLEELWHRDGFRTFLANVDGVVQHACRLRIEATQE